MTRTFTAQIDRWVSMTRRREEVVLKQATNNMLRAVKIVPGINRGGARVRGTIPRDLGALAASLQSSLYGSTMLAPQTGADSYVFTIGAMQIGSVARFSWGGAVAPYAHAIHYGANGVPGTFWIDEMAGGWQGYVRDATREAKARVRP